MHLRKTLFQIFILTVFIHSCPAQNTTKTTSDANLPAIDANDTKTIKQFVSLVEGKKHAVKTDTPELLILTNELQNVHEQYLRKVLEDQRFANLAHGNLTVIKLNFPLKSNSTEEEFNAVTEFVKKYSILKKPLQFMLIDSKTGEELFRVNPALDDPDILLKKIYPLLPGEYDGQWIENFEAGQIIAEKTGRYMLVNFTGSDWCIWCQRLKEEVFEQTAFKKYAEEKLVLVEVDFPRKNPLPEKTALANDELAKRFNIRGYPSVIILDPNGQLAGTTGYVQGGVEEFLTGIKQMMEN